MFEGLSILFFFIKLIVNKFFIRHFDIRSLQMSLLPTCLAHQVPQQRALDAHILAAAKFI